jgi:hypothetical protein
VELHTTNKLEGHVSRKDSLFVDTRHSTVRGWNIISYLLGLEEPFTCYFSVLTQ